MQRLRKFSSLAGGKPPPTPITYFPEKGTVQDVDKRRTQGRYGDKNSQEHKGIIKRYKMWWARRLYQGKAGILPRGIIKLGD